jgi:ubiquitin-protein ligase E3 C
MSARERALLLRFVTSCERAPLLGFDAISPPFRLHRIPVSSDSELLPTAATCKLPTYRLQLSQGDEGEDSAGDQRGRSTRAINEGVGFELT